MSGITLSTEEIANKKRFSHRAWVHASLAVSWDVFTDHERLGEFTDTPMRVVTPGKIERNGLGCLRRLETLGFRVDEVINYWKPLELFGYHVVDSPVVTHHQGLVRFWPLPNGGTEWLYDMQLILSKEALAAAPGLGQMFETGFRNYMACLECECERRAAAFRIPAEPIPIHRLGGELEA